MLLADFSLLLLLEEHDEFPLIDQPAYETNKEHHGRAIYNVLYQVIIEVCLVEDTTWHVVHDQDIICHGAKHVHWTMAKQEKLEGWSK